MFISTEWGSFNNKRSVLPVPPYDTNLNEHSINPGNQMFEKRVSGMCLVELLRIAICSIYSDKSRRLIQPAPSTSAVAPIDSDIPLQRHWAVDSSILSVAEADNSESLAVLWQKIHQSFGILDGSISVEDARVVKAIAHAISTRAAKLAGIAIKAVTIQSGLLEPAAEASGHGDKGGAMVGVAVDGSVVEHYPGFRLCMREAPRAIDQIGHAGEKRIRIGHAKDGSSIGAPLLLS
jgi:hexokinase